MSTGRLRTKGRSWPSRAGYFQVAEEDESTHNVKRKSLEELYTRTVLTSKVTGKGESQSRGEFPLERVLWWRKSLKNQSLHVGERKALHAWVGFFPALEYIKMTEDLRWFLGPLCMYTLHQLYFYRGVSKSQRYLWLMIITRVLECWELYNHGRCFIPASEGPQLNFGGEKTSGVQGRRKVQQSCILYVHECTTQKK